MELKMKFNELLTKDAKELRQICAELKKEQLNLRIAMTMNREVSLSFLRACKKSIARVMTRLSQLDKQK
jgi:ribosomal protein L29